MKRIVTVIGLIAVIVLGAYAGKVWSTWKVNARTSKFNDDIENLFSGLQKYKEQVGSYPVGSNAEIGKALMGKNSKNVIILVSRKNELNAKGELVDPWGTPLRIYFSDSGVLIRSAGPNRRFDDTSSVEFDDFIRSN